MGKVVSKYIIQALFILKAHLKHLYQADGKNYREVISGLVYRAPCSVLLLFS